jgi:uncharacterized membrane protein HdeD (DUF308 family)
LSLIFGLVVVSNPLIGVVALAVRLGRVLLVGGIAAVVDVVPPAFESCCHMSLSSR